MPTRSTIGALILTALLAADGHVSHGQSPITRPPNLLFVSARAAIPAASAPAVNQTQVEKNYYDSIWRRKLGDPPAAHAAEFIHEIYAGNNAEDRDSQVLHLQKALTLRPDDPTNIAIEFHLAIRLMNTDPDHHQNQRMEDAQAVSEHIATRYDHKAYYRDMTEGDSEALEFMVPRSAIWASSYDTAIIHDRAQAQQFADVAVDSLYWTFQKRQADWANAPQPSTEPSPFDRPERITSRLQAWEQRKADAAAGNVLGTYAQPFCDAAVNVYVKAYAEGPADTARVLRQVIAKCPDSPLSASAAARLAKLPPESTPVPALAATASAPTDAAAPEPPTTAPAHATTMPMVAVAHPLLLAALTLTAVASMVLAFLILRKRRV